MKTIYIGRNADNSIVMNDMAISGRHAEIVVGDDGGFTLTDYSTNGTGVNGKLLNRASQVVKYGDLITFPGGFQLDWNMVLKMAANTPEPAPIPTPNNAPNQAPYPPYSDITSGVAKLAFGETFKEGFQLGLKNSLSFIAVTLLAMLTFWIPYFGLGVIIALGDLPAKYVSGEGVNPLYIFEGKYRRYIGNYLISSVLLSFAIIFATTWMVVPGFVMAYAWSLTLLFILRKEQKPVEALTSSHRATYGNKWTMFAIDLVAGIILAVFILLILVLMSAGEALAIIGIILLFAGSLIWCSCSVGIRGSIWKQLNNN